MDQILDLIVFSRWAVLASVLAAGLCALSGSVLLVRRMVLLGIALPQAASAGIALTFLVAQYVKLSSFEAPHGPEAESHEATPVVDPILAEIAADDPLLAEITSQPSAHDHAESTESPGLSHEAMELLGPIGSLTTVLLVLVLLAWSERRALVVQAQWGTVYIASAALSILFLVANPYGEAHMKTMLEGQVLTVTPTQLIVVAIVTFAVFACMSIWRREFLLTSFDPDMAWSLRLNLHGWNIFLYTLLGVTVSVSVMILGPLFTFGYLLLPPFAARPWSTGMHRFVLLSVLLAMLSAFFGTVLSFWRDWPLGASQVVTAAGVLLLSRVLLVVLHRRRLTAAGASAAGASAA